MTFKPYERISIFYWFASLKDTFSRKFPDFFQPINAAAGGKSARLVRSIGRRRDERSDPCLTKRRCHERERSLALDTHRALTELNAQAREYKELNAKKQPPNDSAAQRKMGCGQFLRGTDRKPTASLSQKVLPSAASAGLTASRKQSTRRRPKPPSSASAT